MQEIFDPKNWSDLVNDSSFWSGSAILALATVALLAALYADQIHAWRMHREERIKWTFWNR